MSWEDRLGLIQGLGISLGSFILFDPMATMPYDHYLVDFWESLCGLREITNSFHSSSLWPWLSFPPFHLEKTLQFFTKSLDFWLVGS
ncbi:hypothetical protein P8452_64546 [Trifolium repens]|nr:hypothetical protein P8452_64546 [Trifolium repens]